MKKIFVYIFLSMLILSTSALAKDYFASPNGTKNGLSKESPFKIGDFWKVAKPGDTLHLLDGRYLGYNSMINPPQGLTGEDKKPIKISASNDGKVIIDGQSTNTPVKLYRNNWFVLQGINICNAGSKNNGRVLWLNYSNNNVIKRVIGWDGDPLENSYIFHSSYGSNNLFEDCAGWGAARKIFSQYHENGTIFRRCFFRWTYAACAYLEEGSCYSMGMTFSYACTNSIVENCIGTWDEYPIPPSSIFRNGIFGVDNTTANGGYKILGCIGYHLVKQHGTTRRIFNFSQRNAKTNYTIENCLAYSEKSSLNNYQLVDMSFNGSYLTSIGSGKGPGGVNASIYVEDQNSKVNYCIIQNSTAFGINTGINFNYVLFNNNLSGNYEKNSPQYYKEKNFSLTANKGNLLQYGLDESTRPKVAGKSVGAQIKYKYVNGILTKEKLWPWPMNDRIAEAMILSGYNKKGGLDGNGEIDLTKTIFELGGGTMPKNFNEEIFLYPPSKLRIISKR